MNVLVTAGGTVAPIDDVRRIVNTSTGLLGAQIAEAALRRGASVWHLHAPGALLPFDRLARFDLDAPDPSAEFDRLAQLRAEWERVRHRLHPVPLAEGTVAEYAEALAATLRARSIDLAFLAMAASDYAPEPSPGKLSSGPDALVIRCHRLPKVIRSARDRAPGAYLVGFKLLSGAPHPELIRQAEAACVENRVDLTVANDQSTVRAGRHTIHLVRPGHPVETFGPDVPIADRLVAFAFEQAARGDRQATQVAEEGTQSVPDGIPTKDRGNEFQQGE